MSVQVYTYLRKYDNTVCAYCEQVPTIFQKRVLLIQIKCSSQWILTFPLFFLTVCRVIPSNNIAYVEKVETQIWKPIEMGSAVIHISCADVSFIFALNSPTAKFVKERQAWNREIHVTFEALNSYISLRPFQSMHSSEIFIYNVQTQKRD